jgi:hypothetical protein
MHPQVTITTGVRQGRSGAATADVDVMRAIPRMNLQC